MAAADTMLLSFAAGLAVALLTTPVGVSGAVFLLPVQVSILEVPSPAVTPTNLLFNIVSIPGALARYRARAPLRTPLTMVLLVGTVPGVVIGAVVRVVLIPGATAFQFVAAAFLLPLGVWLCLPRQVPTEHLAAQLSPGRGTVVIALLVGVLGGIYGIGGGSLLSPILVGRGLSVSHVAPAALVTTLVTSVAGAATYVVLGVASGGDDIAPLWSVGLVAGCGGLAGGYLGAHLQPRLPERVLRVGLGVVAAATALLYVVQTVN